MKNAARSIAEIAHRMACEPEGPASILLVWGTGPRGGCALGHAVRTDRAATVAGWEAGFLDETARPLPGGIEVLEIGIPEVLNQRHGGPART